MSFPLIIPGLFVSPPPSTGGGGGGALITTTANLAVPAVGPPTTATVGVSSVTGLAIGQWAYFDDGTNVAWLKITGVGVSSVTVENLDYPGSAAVGTTIASGAILLPAPDSLDPHLYDIKRLSGFTVADVGPSIFSGMLKIQANGFGTVFIAYRLDGAFWKFATSAHMQWNSQGTNTTPGAGEIRGDDTPIQLELSAADFPAIFAIDVFNQMVFTVRGITMLGDPAHGDDCARAISLSGSGCVYDRVNGYGIQGRDGFGIFEASVSTLAIIDKCRFACTRVLEGGVLAIIGGGAIVRDTVFNPGQNFNGTNYQKGATQAHVYVRTSTAPIIIDGCAFNDNGFVVAQIWWKIPSGSASDKLIVKDTIMLVSASVGNTGPPCILIDGTGAQLQSLDILECLFSDAGGHREIQQPQPIAQWANTLQVTVRGCTLTSSLQQNAAFTDPLLFPAKGIIPKDSNGTVYLDNNDGLYCHPYFVGGSPVCEIRQNGISVLYPAHGTFACYDMAEANIINTGAVLTGSGATYAAVAANSTLTLLTTPVGPQTITFAGTENSQATYLATLNAQLQFATAANSGGQIAITLTGNQQMYGASAGHVVSASAGVLAALGFSVGAFTSLPTIASIGDQSAGGHLLAGFGGLSTDACTLLNPDPVNNNRSSFQFRSAQGLTLFTALGSPLAQPFVIAWEGRQRVAATAYVSDGAAANSCAIFGDSGQKNLTVNFGTAATFVVGDTTVFHVYELQVDGANSRLYVDGNLVGEANVGAGALTGITLGQIGGGGTNAGWDLGEWQVFSGRWAPSQRAAFESYCAWAFGLTLPGQASTIANAVQEVRFAIGTGATQLSQTLLPNNAVVLEAQLNITAPYSAGATIQVGNATTAALLMTAGQSNPQVAGLYSNQQDTLFTPAGAVQVTVAGAPGAGAGVCIVRYVQVPNV